MLMSRLIIAHGCWLLALLWIVRGLIAIIDQDRVMGVVSVVFLLVCLSGLASMISLPRIEEL